ELRLGAGALDLELRHEDRRLAADVLGVRDRPLVGQEPEAGEVLDVRVAGEPLGANLLAQAPAARFQLVGRNAGARLLELHGRRESRSRIAARIRSATSGMSCSIALNSRSNITISRMSLAAITDAVRRSVSSSAISPKKSPGPSSAIRSPSLTTSAPPSTITKNSCAKRPSVASSRPAGT